MDQMRPDAVADILRRTRPWVLFVAIMVFIGVALMLVVGIGMGIFGVATGQTGAAVLMIVYPVMGLLYLIPGVYLWRYASRIADYQTRPDAGGLASALDAQRSFWKFVGVLTIVWIALGCLGVAAAILIPTLMRMSGQA